MTPKDTASYVERACDALISLASDYEASASDHKALEARVTALEPLEDTQDASNNTSPKTSDLMNSEPDVLTGSVNKPCGVTNNGRCTCGQHFARGEGGVPNLLTLRQTFSQVKSPIEFLGTQEGQVRCCHKYEPASKWFLHELLFHIKPLEPGPGIYLMIKPRVEHTSSDGQDTGFFILDDTCPCYDEAKTVESLGKFVAIEYRRFRQGSRRAGETFQLLVFVVHRKAIVQPEPAQ